jgi:hypothetical protein
MREFPADDGRLAELILHVSARCADWEHFDPILLDRILFQADFLHYRTYGAPITGQTYRRGPSGPAPRGLSRVLRGLAREFAVVETPEGDGLHVRRRPAALRGARLSAFDARELATVEQVLRHYREGREGAGRRSDSPQSADWRSPPQDAPDYFEIPWREAGPRAILPYSLALAAPEPVRARSEPAPLAACPA